VLDFVSLFLRCIHRAKASYRLVIFVRFH